MPRLPWGNSLAATLIVLAVAASWTADAVADAAATAAAFPSIVAADAGCVSQLPTAERQLLALRFGTGGTAGESSTATAEALNLSRQGFIDAEFAAIRHLEQLRRSGDCVAAAVTTTTTSAAVSTTTTTTAAAAVTASTPAPTSDATSSSGLSWTSPTELALLAVIALAAGALFYGLRRDFGPPRTDRGRFRWRDRR